MYQNQEHSTTQQPSDKNQGPKIQSSSPTSTTPNDNKRIENQITAKQVSFVEGLEQPLEGNFIDLDYEPAKNEQPHQNILIPAPTQPTPTIHDQVEKEVALDTPKDTEQKPQKNSSKQAILDNKGVEEENQIDTSSYAPQKLDQTLLTNENQRQLQAQKSTSSSAVVVSCQQQPPITATFDKEPFNQMLAQYDKTQSLPPSVNIAQSFLMTSNMKEAAGQVAQSMDAGVGYFLQSDFLGDNLRLSDSMAHIGKLVSNLGPCDKSTNFILESRRLAKAQATEDRLVRDKICEEIVDGLEYVRTKEKIAETKQRVKHLLIEEDYGDQINRNKIKSLDYNNDVDVVQRQLFKEKRIDNKGGVKEENQSVKDKEDSIQTEEDSQKAYERHQADRTRIRQIIRQMRRDARTHLNLVDYKRMPLTQIYSKLRQSGQYRRRRELKLQRKCSDKLKRQQQWYSIEEKEQKGNAFKFNCKETAIDKDQGCEKSERLKAEIEQIDSNIEQSLAGELDQVNHKQLKNELQKQIKQLKTMIGLEKRMKGDPSEIAQKADSTSIQDDQDTGCQKQLIQQVSVTDLDQMPLDANSFQIQNLLFDFCGIGNHQRKVYQNKQKGLKKGTDDLFGRIKKLPCQSSLFQSEPFDKKQSVKRNSPEQNDEYVKIIGLEPEKLMKSLDKYKVVVERLPQFSNIFDNYESFISTLGGQNLVQSAVPSSNQEAQSTQNGQVSAFARQDGRAVISLNFNPNELDSKQKRRIYDGATKEIREQREKQTLALSQLQREKQEAAALKRTWTNIARRDIPKAFKAYQKYKNDLDSNTKKLARNTMNEVKKKAIRSQRVAREATKRAKTLTRDIIQFWKRRDKELADIKRKKEKFDKELKKRQQEEEEALLQKKRLEYLMKQSEIYAHFMAKKVGMSEEMKETTQNLASSESEINYKRVEVDEVNAKKRTAKLIMEDRRRLREFDADQANQGSSMLHEDDQNLGTSRINNLNPNSEDGDGMVDEEELDVNRFDLDTPAKQIEQPTILKATLKHYQLRGLRWLDNLYEQGINGILADEMGLGKTIQAISLMAHIAERKNVWGPFLVIVPVITLHNWQNELEKFCPQLKVLPYFGNIEERKKLARFLDPRNLCNPDMRIHVLITSYNLIVNNPKEQAKLLKIKWNYMILDEAQAIKNNSSRRWKVLLQFQARNRLLLTGTPIQNSMAELWALLHFIMPKLFDNHEQFQEWFSKDIEASSMDKGELNKHQLKRLHAVLKPFMLRRLKRDVEQEIGQKTEVELFCNMTYRQKLLYKQIRNKIPTTDLFKLGENKEKMENLMNLVMQFRKVCNHPDLFERQVGRSPFIFNEMQVGVQPNPSFQSSPEVRTQNENPIKLHIPKLVFDECFLVDNQTARTFQKLIKNEDVAFSSIGSTTHFDLFNIFNSANFNTQFTDPKSSFGILALLAQGNSFSMGDLEYLYGADPLMRHVALVHHLMNQSARRLQSSTHSCMATIENNDQEIQINFWTQYAKTDQNMGQSKKDHQKLNVNIIDQMRVDVGKSLLFKGISITSQVDNSLDILPPLICNDPYDWMHERLTSNQTRKEVEKMFVPPCIASMVTLESFSSGTFKRFDYGVRENFTAKKVLLGAKKFKPAHFLGAGQTAHADLTSTSLVPFMTKEKEEENCGGMLGKGILNCADMGASQLIDVPKCGNLVTDCAKMRVFADLVIRLHAEKHRCLVFCQMTRMLDILEDYLSMRKFTFFRLDGSTNLQDRRYMVDEFQRNDNIFAFLLSTRAGGLGINLIAADTVIFYDNDWNPTMDEQATDRAHRIGQTKPVTVYRLVTRGTVEEKIVKRAKQKQNVQSTVYGDTFKMKEVMSMVMDAEMGLDGGAENGCGAQNEDNLLGGASDNQQAQASFIKTGRKGTRKNKKDSPSKKDAQSSSKTPQKAAALSGQSKSAMQAMQALALIEGGQGSKLKNDLTNSQSNVAVQKSKPIVEDQLMDSEGEQEEEGQEAASEEGESEIDDGAPQVTFRIEEDEDRKGQQQEQEQMEEEKRVKNATQNNDEDEALNQDDY